MLASILSMDEQSSYYKVCDYMPGKGLHIMTKNYKSKHLLLQI